MISSAFLAYLILDQRKKSRMAKRLEENDDMIDTDKHRINWDSSREMNKEVNKIAVYITASDLKKL